MLDITFEFIGGPHDGKVTSGLLGEGTAAEQFYLSTNQGTVGFVFKVVSEYAVRILDRQHVPFDTQHQFPPHVYAVTERTEVGREVYVRAEYVPSLVRPTRRDL